MKRLSLIWALAAGAVILAMGGNAQVVQEKKSLEQRVELLEKRLKETEGELAGLRDALKEASVHVDTLLDFSRAQAKSAEAMAGTLDASEEAGFTAGINFKSREILLSGWRKQLEATRKNVPPAPDQKQPEKEDPRKRARSRR